MRVKKAAATAIAATALTVGLVATPSAASATPTNTDPASPQAVPDCIYDLHETDGSKHRVELLNYCDSQKRVKVIWNWAPDSECFVLDPDGRAASTRSWPATWGGLESC